MKNNKPNLIPLFPLFEKLFGISKIQSKEDLERLIKKLEKDGDKEIPIGKYAELYEKFKRNTKQKKNKNR